MKTYIFLEFSYNMAETKKYQGSVGQLTKLLEPKPKKS